MFKLAFFFFVSPLFAANQYQVTLQLSKAGQPIEESRISVLEGEDGVITTAAGHKDNSTFSVIVHETGDNQLNLSYRITRQRPESRFDFARADIALKPVTPLVVMAQDDLEEDVEMKVSVVKR